MRWRLRTRHVVAATSVFVLTGCAGLLPPDARESGAPSAPPAATAPDAPDTGTPTPRGSTPGSSTPPTAPTTPQATGSGAPAPGPSAEEMLVETSSLPQGWETTEGRDTGGYRMTVCGVDIEPAQPVDTAARAWRRSASGPHLEQHVRTYSGTTATTVIGGLNTAIPGCTTYTAADDRGGRSSFTVEKLTVPGAPRGTVAWRQRVAVPVPGATPPTTTDVVQDVAVVRRGTAVILVNSYDVGKPGDVTALSAALVAAIPAPTPRPS